MIALDVLIEKAEQAKDKAAEAKEKAPLVDNVTAAAKDKAAEVKDKAAEVKDKFAPAIKDLSAEAGLLAKEAESEINILKDQARDVKRGGVSSLFKKPEPDDIVVLSRKARRKANKLERKAAKLERKLRKIEKKQLKHLKKLEKENRK